MKLSIKQKENIFQPLKGIRMELNEGTVRSGKTMSDAQKMALVYAAHPDPNHLVLAYNQDGDGLYFEVTFNGNKQEFYFDVYKKQENICIKSL